MGTGDGRRKNDVRLTETTPWTKTKCPKFGDVIRFQVARFAISVLTWWIFIVQVDLDWSCILHQPSKTAVCTGIGGAGVEGKSKGRDRNETST